MWPPEGSCKYLMVKGLWEGLREGKRGAEEDWVGRAWGKEKESDPWGCSERRRPGGSLVPWRMSCHWVKTPATTDKKQKNNNRETTGTILWVFLPIYLFHHRKCTTIFFTAKGKENKTLTWVMNLSCPSIGHNKPPSSSCFLSPEVDRQEGPVIKLLWVHISRSLKEKCGCCPCWNSVSEETPMQIPI